VHARQAAALHERKHVPDDAGGKYAGTAPSGSTSPCGGQSQVQTDRRVLTFLRDLFVIVLLVYLWYLGVRGRGVRAGSGSMEPTGPGRAAWTFRMAYGSLAQSSCLGRGNAVTTLRGDWSPSWPPKCVSAAITYLVFLGLLGVHVPAWVLIHRLGVDGRQSDLWFGAVTLIGLWLTTLSYVEWDLAWLSSTIPGRLVREGVSHCKHHRGGRSQVDIGLLRGDCGPRGLLRHRDRDPHHTARSTRSTSPFGSRKMRSMVMTGMACRLITVESEMQHDHCCADLVFVRL